MGTKRSLNDHELESSAKKTAGHWSKGLLSSMEDPELKVEEDDTTVVIKDKYPKAEVHYLILPKEDISDMSKLQKRHLPLLKNMFAIGERIMEENPNREIRLGFHAVASMSRLHMHVISQDFNSKCLKTKRHWNSFTSSYFVPASSIIAELEKNGCIKRMASKTAESLLATPLKCHKCSLEPKTMPQLKTHLMTHFKKSGCT
ncbi:aprataxin [Ischnura elegans]|uniref:aprataxin n=1 Tax=Ischnura elegans TaxID=197161 RepID=UPI001ED89CD1|nr:aprataxin [Ischnura elegans]